MRIGEAGAVIDILKKHGGVAACTDEPLRKHLAEESADIRIFYNDILLCCGISAEEPRDAYVQKFEKNMHRWCPRFSWQYFHCLSRTRRRQRNELRGKEGDTQRENMSTVPDCVG